MRQVPLAGLLVACASAPGPTAPSAGAETPPPTEAAHATVPDPARPVPAPVRLASPPAAAPLARAPDRPRSADLPAPLPVRPNARLPLGEPAPDPRAALLRRRLTACQAHPHLDEALARCMCEALCRERYPSSLGPMTVRYPFVDVDGVEFHIAADGRVTRCRYSVGARELAAMTCPQESR